MATEFVTETVDTDPAGYSSWKASRKARKEGRVLEGVVVTVDERDKAFKKAASAELRRSRFHRAAGAVRTAAARVGDQLVDLAIDISNSEEFMSAVEHLPALAVGSAAGLATSAISDNPKAGAVAAVVTTSLVSKVDEKATSAVRKRRVRVNPGEAVPEGTMPVRVRRLSTPPSM